MKKLKAEKRTKTGKGAARSLRRENKIPAILYGHGEETILLQIDEKDWKVAGGGSERLTVDFGKKMDVIVKDMQWHPVTGKLLHVDFQHLHNGEKIRVKIPIVVEDSSLGVTQGGILEHILPEVEIECLPRDIPKEFKIDVTDLNIGDSIHLKDLPPIEGDFVEDLERTVLTVLAPKVIEEEIPPTEEIPEEVPEGEIPEGEAPEGKEPEVIKGKKEEKKALPEEKKK